MPLREVYERTFDEDVPRPEEDTTLSSKTVEEKH